MRRSLLRNVYLISSKPYFQDLLYLNEVELCLFQNIKLNSTLINIRSKKLFCSFSRVKAPKWHLCRFSKNNVEETSLFAWWKFLKKFSIIPWGLHYTRRIFHLVMSKTPLRCFLHACRLICHAIFRVEENKKSVHMLQWTIYL